MSDDAFELVEEALRCGGPESTFDFLARKFREEKKYPQLFEARLMKKRHELGLPLIQTESSGDWPEETQRAYEEGFVQAAREVGGLFLADGNIQDAWPYFRAIGETGPVAAAIEKAQPQEGIDRIVEIAFFERVNPRKGFELVLAKYGICKAITIFLQYPDRKGREDCARLLVRTLHGDLVRNLKRAITQREGQEPETESVSPLINGRGWLFENNNYYVDTSHLVSILQFSIEVSDRETLALALELSEYGTRLSPLFQFRGDPPFQNVYVDHSVYLRGLLDEDPEGAVAHFRQKVAESDPNHPGNASAQVLVRLLARLGRHAEAIEFSLQHLRDVDSAQLACPSILQLCQLAGDHDRLMRVARERGDLVSFTAALLQI